MKKFLLLTTLLGLSNLSIGQVAFEENFDGETFPPEGWSFISTHETNNWYHEVDAPVAGTGSAAVAWIAEDQDESLISPSFSLVGYTQAYLSFTAVLGYEYMVDPNPNGDLLVSVSTDGGTTWDQVWVEEDQGEYVDYEPLSVSVNLAEYVGEADVQLKFNYVGNDADTALIDDIAVAGCSPVSGFLLDAVADNSATLSWEGTIGVTYELEYGETGFTQGNGTLAVSETPSYEFTGLMEGTSYSFYIRSNCGGTSTGAWQGPYNFYTTLSSPADLNYTYSFESGTLAAGGWSTSEDNASWGIYTGTGALVQEGEGLAAAFGDTVATDAWLFSRGLNLVGGTTVTISYYIREYKAAGNGGVNNLAVTIGSDATIEAQTTVLNNHANFNTDTYTLQTATFPVVTTGVYNLGFHYTGSAQSALNNGAILLDAVSVMDPLLSVNEFLASNLVVSPNPARDIVRIASSENITVNTVSITDVNGRVIRTSNHSASTVEINISDLASGIYLMNINSDKGTAVKKIVKN